jgi:hypothetical protein
MIRYKLHGNFPAKKTFQPQLVCLLLYSLKDRNNVDPVKSKI